MTAHPLLAAVLLAPWGLLLLRPLWPAAWSALPLILAAVPAVAAGFLLPIGAELRVPAVMGGLRLELDEIAQAFLLPAALIWLVAGWLVRPLHPALAHKPGFTALWLIALGGNVMVILAQDLLGLYIGMTLMSFAGLGLIISSAATTALRAGRHYLAMMLLAELALFVAISLIANTHPSDKPWPLVDIAASLPGITTGLLMLAFGVKLGALGLHAWLPHAHPVAPTAASAVLGGVMIKVGLLAWLRLSSVDGTVQVEWLENGLLLLGAAAVFYGIVRGLAINEPKTILAWSSVSQMGLGTMLAGTTLHSPSAAGAAIALLAIHHGLAKALLFLGVGLLTRVRLTFARFVWIALWLPALALAAAPGTSGALAKSAMAIALTEGPPAAATFLALSSFATMLLMLHFLRRARPHTVQADAPSSPSAVMQMLPAWGLLLLALLALPWWMGRDTVAAERALAPAAMTEAIAPLLAALLLAPLLSRATGRMSKPVTLRLPLAAACAVQRGWRSLAVQLAHRERQLHAWHHVGRWLVAVAFMLAIAMGLAMAPLSHHADA